jgi:hypothetical protein
MQPIFRPRWVQLSDLACISRTWRRIAMGKGILGLCKEKALHRAAHAPLHNARRPEPAPSHGSRKALNLLTDLLTSKPEGI